MNSILIKKIFSFILSFLLMINPVVIPVYVFAEENEEILSPTESPTTESPQSSPTPLSTSTIETGESVAVGTQEVTANKTEDIGSGTISVDGCSVDINTECPITINNDATIEGEATVDSVSGENSISDVVGDALTQTGTASATAISQIELNTTVISLSVGPTGSSGSTGTMGVTGSSGPTGSFGSNGFVDIDNSVSLDTEISARAVTGANTESNIGNNAVIDSGGACATAYSLNIVNTTLMGSNVRFLVINIDGTKIGDIDLNQLWREIQKEQTGRKTLLMDGYGSVVDITNSSSTFTKVAATAISGDNSIDTAGGDATIQSGNAFATAGLLNIENSTIIESQILVVVINISGNLTGDIILPSSERFIEDATNVTYSSSPPMPLTVFSNTAVISGSSTSAVSDSGTNTAIGASPDQYIESGAAYASANERVFANIQMYIDYYYQILFNNFGRHIGGVSGLDDPEEATGSTPFTSSIYDIAQNFDSTGSGTQQSNNGSTTISNIAESSYDVLAVARSGGNSARDINGTTTITTGTSVAIANVLSFLNTTIFGNFFLFPVVNLFGVWTGNFVLERPDMEVMATAAENPVMPGSDVEYTIAYKNNTGEESRDVSVTVTFPPDLAYVSTTYPFPPLVEGNTMRFHIGTVNGHEGSSFIMRAYVQATIAPDESKPVSFFQTLKRKIVPVIYAAEKEKLEIVNVSITTSDTESNSKNNQTSAQIKVTIPDTTSLTSSTPSYDVKLQVNSSNNAGDFVYPGQTVHFTVTLNNDGASLAKDVVIKQILQSVGGQEIGALDFSLPTILSKKSTAIQYDLLVPPAASAGMYEVKSMAVGFDESGKKIETNGSSAFVVRLKELGVIEAVNAAEEVKGAETENISVTPCIVKKEYWPYMLITALAVLWFVEFMRRKRLQSELKKRDHSPTLKT